MNDAQRERLKEALLILGDLPPGERRAWIARRLADDPKLQGEAASLLEAGSRGDDAILDSLVVPPDLLNRSLPRRVGPFVVEGLLGQGGMANVYRAYQEAPQRRAVAVKVLRPGRAGAELLARFEAEAQVISRLDHRNIARLIGVGTDDSGLPYIAMDLVDGPPITEYARLHQLDLHRRLELFVQACRGVQHAHNRGILHRDIKPSNILVAEENGEPVARVIDFGVARLLEPDSDARRTVHGQIVGTVAYMSPEQADPLMPDADIRSDVYSLGVLLYELIADRNPTQHLEFAGKSSAQIHRMLVTSRPAPPGQAVGRALRDIDCVALKAIEADPAARYASAGDLADDVQRYLRGEGVTARPPTRRQALARFIRRHRTLTAAVAVVLLALVLGVAGLTYGLRRAIIERDRAAAAEIAASKQRDRAQRAAEVFDEVALTLRSLVLTPRLGINAPYVELLVRGAGDFLASPPESVAVRARVGFSLGQALNQAGERALAKQLLEGAIRDLESSEFDRENAPTRDSMLFTSYTMLAAIERADGSDDRAEALWERAIELGATLEGVAPGELIAASASFADVLAARGSLERAERVLQEGRARAASLGANERFLALLDGALAGVYARMRRYDEAIELGTSAYELRASGRESSRPFTVMLGLRHARTLLDAGEGARALPVAENVAQLAEESLGPSHANTLTATQYRLLALAKVGRAEPGDIELAGAIAQQAAGVEGTAGGRAWRAQLAFIEILAAAGRTDEAVTAAQQLEHVVSEARGPESRDLALLRWELGRVFQTDAPRYAASVLERAWTTYAADLGQAAMVSRLIASDLARLYSDAGAAADAAVWDARSR